MEWNYGFYKQLALTAWAGLRLALLLPVDGTGLAATLPRILFLLCAHLALQFCGDFWVVEGPGQWNSFGLTGSVFPLALYMVAAISLALLDSRHESLLPLLTAILALALPLSLADRLLPYSIPRFLEDSWLEEYGNYLVPFWLALAAAIAAMRLLQLSRWRMAGALAISCLLLGLPLSSVDRGDPLWVEQDESLGDARRKYYALVEESVYYQQPRILQQSLERIQAQRPGFADLYYVGVAGYASQDVFLKEVRAVEKLMGERFGAEGRTLTLANNYASVAEYPVASVTALRRVLQHIGGIMDKSEDILFLFMTSHGSRESGLSIQLWPMRFNDVAPAALKQILDDAGFRWRVIIVSACYSGTFVKPLQDDHTIVITAAAADRNSFGCSNELEWTYFGQAFFNETLRSENDLVTAFQRAKQSIEQRERRENVEIPSQPQIAAGRAMQEKWQDYLRQLQSGAPLAANYDALDVRGYK